MAGYSMWRKNKYIDCLVRTDNLNKNLPYQLRLYTTNISAPVGHGWCP